MALVDRYDKPLLLFGEPPPIEKPHLKYGVPPPPRTEAAASARQDDPDKEKAPAAKKKKKATTLKKIIMAEREFRKDTAGGESGAEEAAPAADGGAKQGSVPSQPATAAAATTDAKPGVSASNIFANFLAADAPPQFIPFQNKATPAATVPPTETDKPVSSNSVGANIRARSLGRGAPMPASVPDFVPSWCRAEAPQLLPAESQAAGAEKSSSSRQPPESRASDAGKTEMAPPLAELPLAAAMERLADRTKTKKSQAAASDKKAAEGKSKKGKKGKGGEQQPPRGAEFEVRPYVHQLLSDDLDEKVKLVLGELVRFQDRAKEKMMTYAKNKRFCVGMREAKRAVVRAKAKGIILAPNLEVCTAEGGLDDTLEDLIEVCRESEVPVIFALSRNRIGKALGRNVRQSVVTVLSAEGVHQEFKAICRQAEELRRLWVMQRMMHCEGPVPVPPRLPLGALADLAVSEYEGPEGSGGDDDAGLSTADEAADRAAQLPSRERRNAALSPEEQRRRRDEQLLEQERLMGEQRAAAAAERAAEKKAALEQKKAEKRAAQEAVRQAEQEQHREARKAAKAVKEAERRARLADKQAQEQAIKDAEAEEERRLEEKQRKAEEEKRRLREEAAEKRAKALAELAAKAEAERQAAEAAKAAEEAEDSDDDSELSDVPLNFNANLF
eukprot:TRINITY_DN30488_c0_g1_i1.p1 TRINITY_DN30488_c0_g1~~TRINITY_DN30488_c0_g1_i1.p1  ORF type:complete len:672 (+),score=221.77 TRINITY_DN30488_c0_g1_i1:58-2073(+)